MKSTEVPNSRRSSACDCTCALTRIDHCLLTLSCLPCAFCFVPAYAEFAHEFLTPLSLALCNLSFAFLADFTLSDFTAPTFHSFLSQITLLFDPNERHDHSVHMRVFRLTGTAALHCGHTFVGGILTANGQYSNSQ